MLGSVACGWVEPDQGSAAEGADGQGFMSSLLTWVPPLPAPFGAATVALGPVGTSVSLLPPPFARAAGLASLRSFDSAPRRDPPPFGVADANRALSLATRRLRRVRASISTLLP